MEQMNTLQEVINKRAEVRLEKDLYDLGQLIQKNRLTSANDSSQYETGHFPVLGLMEEKKVKETATLRRLFGCDMQGKTLRAYGEFLKQLKTYWLPIYIQEETDAFMQQVDNMQAQADQLAEDVEDLRRRQNQ